VKFTVATLALRDVLARSLAECWHDGDKKLVAEKWENEPGFQQYWMDRAADTLFNSPDHPVPSAIDRVRREAFEAGGSPAIGVLLTELEEAEPGEYQEGLARAVYLLSQEMAQHYGAIFDAGLRVGREQAKKVDSGG
jgi:hypothetical protein